MFCNRFIKFAIQDILRKGATGISYPQYTLLYSTPIMVRIFVVPWLSYIIETPKSRHSGYVIPCSCMRWAVGHAKACSREPLCAWTFSTPGLRSSIIASYIPVSDNLTNSRRVGNSLTLRGSAESSTNSGYTLMRILQGPRLPNSVKCDLSWGGWGNAWPPGNYSRVGNCSHDTWR